MTITRVRELLNKSFDFQKIRSGYVQRGEGEGNRQRCAPGSRTEGRVGAHTLTGRSQVAGLPGVIDFCTERSVIRWLSNEVA